MEDLCICKICKKVFTDAQGLNKHRMAQHPQSKQPQQSNSNINSRDIITHQFRNNSNISITRIQKEANNSVIVVSQSAMNQNHNSFRKGAVAMSQSQSITVRRQEMKLQKQGEGGRVRPPFRSPDARIKGAASSIKSMVIGAGGGLEIDDETSDWQKWEPGLHKDRIGDNLPSSTTPVGGKPGGPIISKSAAEIALSAFSPAQLSSTTARKSVPQLLRMVPNSGGQGTNGGGGKRPAPGVKVSSTSQRIAPGGGNGGAIRGNSANSAVADIMQNLGKMKSMNQQGSRPTVATPNQKMISLSQSKKVSTSAAAAAAPYQPPKIQAQQPPQKQAHQPFRVTKPPEVSKSKAKIVPRNAFNNALPKPGAKPGQALASSKRLLEPAADDMEVDSSDEEEEDDDDDDDEQDTEEEEPIVKRPPPPTKKPVPPPPTKKPVPPPPTKSKAAVAGGKAPPQKSLATNRFNPIQSPKKGKGKAAVSPVSPPPPPFSTTAAPKGSPNGKSKAGGTSSTANGSSKQPAASTVTSVVAKKSAPPPTAAKNTKKKKKGSDDTFKKLKAYVPSMPGTDYDMPKLSAIGSYTNRDGHQVWVCLVCNEKEHEESSRDMICCEMCEDWYHWECVGIRQAMEEEDPWYCKRCIYQSAGNPKKDFPKIFKNDLLDL